MKKLVAFLFIVLFVIGTVGAASALTVDAVSGQWTDVSGGSEITGIGTNEIRWGTPSSGSSKSGFRFDGNAPSSFYIEEAFVIGAFTHFNFPNKGALVSSAQLSVYLSFSEPAGLNDTLGFIFNIDETPNNSQPATNPNNNDLITFPSAFASETFKIDGIDYTLELLGFGAFAASFISGFSTVETKRNTTQLWAKVTTPPVSSVPEPATMVLIGTSILGLAGFSRKKFKK